MAQPLFNHTHNLPLSAKAQQLGLASLVQHNPEPLQYSSADTGDYASHTACLSFHTV
jgi:hypothetical protein